MKSKNFSFSKYASLRSRETSSMRSTAALFSADRSRICASRSFLLRLKYLRCSGSNFICTLFVRSPAPRCSIGRHGTGRSRFSRLAAVSWQYHILPVHVHHKIFHLIPVRKRAQIVVNLRMIPRWEYIYNSFVHRIGQNTWNFPYSVFPRNSSMERTWGSRAGLPNSSRFIQRPMDDSETPRELAISFRDCFFRN